MDESVLALLGSLAEIQRELGADVYGAAVERARLAIAAEVLVEAERRALRRRRQIVKAIDGAGVVVPFPGNP
ncbi:hypothetical protein ASF41_13030 [Methylobacterium sp. Leaf111]|uniref:hypothetical protein n=1 Tax=Methylobacterium sp. Leaf111 TaxID=1736257 RepID=UPI0006F283DC|nr:hypothetical protein [Methylobacterium sp. Leaf111]KQP51107.1 hypothetical protein ASF41_13030 [Methylobacterium sp. Leaf111]